MEQNMHLRTLRNLAVPLTILMMASSCSLLSTKQIEVSEEKVEEAVKAVPEPIIQKVKTVVSDVANWIVPAKYEKMTNILKIYRKT